MLSTNAAAATTQDAGANFISFPYEISFVDCDPSAAVRFQIEQCLAKVNALYDRIIDSKVTVRINHRQSRNRYFHIHVQMDIPGRRLMVNRDVEVRGRNTAVQTVIREAFHKLVRQLEDFVKMRHSYSAKPEIPAPIVEETEMFEWEEAYNY